MKNPVQLTETIDPIQTSLRPSSWRCQALLVSLAFGLACLAISPPARAVSPPPDGGYSNGNTAEGEDALFSLDPSSLGENTAVGFHALYNDIVGFGNTAIGWGALEFTTGAGNTATGVGALGANTSGVSNTANGFQALNQNTSGINNMAAGIYALSNNTIGNHNVANGVDAMIYNTTGSSNTANGGFALAGNTTGNYNAAVGSGALRNNTTGDNNIALGANASANLTTGSNDIDIGNAGIAGESDTIRIGTKDLHKSTFIAGIAGKTIRNGVGVIINASGQLGTIQSSARFKDQIKPMDKASEAILKLEPVTFRYKAELDPDGIPQFGLVAEDVAKINPDLVARDDEGKPYTVRYEAVNAMLLNEFLKEHRKVEKLAAAVGQLRSAAAQQKELQAAVAQQRDEIEILTASLLEQAEQI
jgi:Chaperone of endosialidase